MKCRHCGETKEQGKPCRNGCDIPWASVRVTTQLVGDGNTLVHAGASYRTAPRREVDPNDR